MNGRNFSWLVLFRRDLVLVWRNGHVLVTALLMLVMIALTLLLPAKIAPRSGWLILDSRPGEPLRPTLAGRDNVLFLDSETELRLELARNTGRIGVIVTGSTEAPAVTVLSGRELGEREERIITAGEDVLLYGQAAASARVEYIDNPVRQPPLYLRGLPVFLVFEAGILGFLLVAVFLFQEKQEGTIRAYRVSPGGLAGYVGAKTAVFTLLALLYALGVIGAALLRGAWPALPGLLLTMTAAAASLTLLGLGFAAFFDNLSQWFFPGLGFLLLNMAPFLGLFNPGFQPAWLMFAPSWPFLRLTEFFLQPAGNPLPLLPLVTGAAWLLGSLVFASASVKFNLLRRAT